MKKFVIVGMNSPKSSEPLSTDPPTGSGHRLWQLATARSGISQEDWLEIAHRINLCEGEWNIDDAMRLANSLRTDLAATTTIFLGVEVCRAMWFAEPPLQWDRRGRPWVMIPHPSGQNIWYNNKAFCAAVECLLDDLIEMTQWKKTDDHIDTVSFQSRESEQSPSL